MCVHGGEGRSSLRKPLSGRAPLWMVTAVSPPIAAGVAEQGPYRGSAPNWGECQLGCLELERAGTLAPAGLAGEHHPEVVLEQAGPSSTSRVRCHPSPSGRLHTLSPSTREGAGVPSVPITLLAGTPSPDCAGPAMTGSLAWLASPRGGVGTPPGDSWHSPGEGWGRPQAVLAAENTCHGSSLEEVGWNP